MLAKYKKTKGNNVKCRNSCNIYRRGGKRDNKLRECVKNLHSNRNKTTQRDRVTEGERETMF